MKGFFIKSGFYFRRLYRLSVSAERQETMLVNDILKLHRDAGWRFGYFEADKLVRSGFEVAPGISLVYYYQVSDNHFHCRVRVLEEFPEESTEQLFILAAHFNNLLNHGVVVVDADDHFVEYQVKQSILLPLLYTGELYNQIMQHFNGSKDIHTSFLRLIEEHEAPAIIIADLLRSRQKDSAS